MSLRIIFLMSVLLIQNLIIIDCKIFHNRKDFVVREIVRSVVGKTKSEGIQVIHVNSKKVINNKFVHDNWMRVIAAFTTVASVNSFKNDSRYFSVKDRTKGMTPCGIKNCHCLNYSKPTVPQILASDRIMIIAIVPFALFKNVKFDFFNSLSCSESSPKILLILVADKKLRARYYRSTMNLAFDRRFVNLDIVEVTPKRKIRRRAITFDHRIVQFDPASSRVTIRPYSRKTTSWFKDKVQNYQARKVTVYLLNKEEFAKDPYYYDLLKTRRIWAKTT